MAYVIIVDTFARFHVDVEPVGTDDVPVFVVCDVEIRDVVRVFGSGQSYFGDELLVRCDGLVRVGVVRVRVVGTFGTFLDDGNGCRVSACGECDFGCASIVAVVCREGRDGDCVASAVAGVFTDPRTLGDMPEFVLPEKFTINDNMIVPPADEKDMDSIEVLRGPNIKPFPVSEPLAETIDAKCSLKVGDNITTDHIMPAGAKILPLRSNIPAISQHCFTICDEQFPSRAKEMGKSIIVGGSNYGQGSSREHAALAPLYLGIKAVLVKSFARIHRANLINAGILPLTFVNEADYDAISQGDELVLDNVRAEIEAGKSELTVINKTTGKEIPVLCELSGRTKDIILAGGLLDYTRESMK